MRRPRDRRQRGKRRRERHEVELLQVGHAPLGHVSLGEAHIQAVEAEDHDALGLGVLERTSAEEREVMSRARCADLAQVRRALNDCAGDVDAAAEFLLALNTWEQDVTGEIAG